MKEKGGTFILVILPKERFRSPSLGRTSGQIEEGSEDLQNLKKALLLPRNSTVFPQAWDFFSTLSPQVFPRFAKVFHRPHDRIGLFPSDRSLAFPQFSPTATPGFCEET